MKVAFLPQPLFADEPRLGDYLELQLSLPKWTHFYAAVAFVKKSGVQHLFKSLKSFSSLGTVRISVGIDLGGSSIEGLNLLHQALDDRGDIWIYHNEGTSTFHPKIYLFFNKQEAELVIGSGNLTEGGLFTNYEASIISQFNLKISDDKTVFDKVVETLDSWSISGKDLVKALDSDVLKELIAERYILPEILLSKALPTTHQVKLKSSKGAQTSLFKRVTVPKPPPSPLLPIDLPEYVNEEDYEVATPKPIQAQGGNKRGFIMTLQRTDVGYGQTNAGTSRRSPEIFIPLSARDHDPQFWGWPQEFTEDGKKPGKYDRRNVAVRLGGEIINVNMMTWPDKHDFRIRSSKIRSIGNIGDLIRLERSNGKMGYSYYVEIIPTGSSTFTGSLDLCTNSVQNSAKRWGYY